MSSPALKPFSLPPQTDPPYPPKETLPTMYDLPSEDPEEPGLPDEFHLLQPQLLRETFVPPNLPSENVFVAADMNLYYDVTQPYWHKRPDWFAVLGGSRFYQGHDMRLSYVMWQERIAPHIIIELLSPGTEKEDLGTAVRKADTPPSKWEVYEQHLRVPYYFVFSRYTGELHVFCLQGKYYAKQNLSEPRIWLEDVGLGLGVWEGQYDKANTRWIRWYDAEGNWLPNREELAQAAESRAQAAENRADERAQVAEQLGIRTGLLRSAKNMKQAGIASSVIAEVTGLSVAEIVEL